MRGGNPLVVCCCGLKPHQLSAFENFQVSFVLVFPTLQAVQGLEIDLPRLSSDRVRREAARHPRRGRRHRYEALSIASGM